MSGRVMLLVAPPVFWAPPVCCRSGLLVVPVGGGFPLLLLVAPLVFRAPARPRDRHTRASLGVVDLEARPGPAAADQHRGLAPPPPTGTAARPSGPSGALHTSGARSL